MSTSSITLTLQEHYKKTFEKYGVTARGVDWGVREEDALLRYDNMLSVIRERDASVDVPKILDVGCGFGGLLDRAKSLNVELNYFGIDVCDSMIVEGSNRHAEARFECVDIFDFETDVRFDYVVCNGILTQKLDASILEMDLFAQNLIRKMFSMCQSGIAFNVMSTRVNFMADNLYYRSPVELFAWCFSEITPHIRLDHSYPLYEYTLYLYRP